MQNNEITISLYIFVLSTMIFTGESEVLDTSKFIIPKTHLHSSSPSSNRYVYTSVRPVVISQEPTMRLEGSLQSIPNKGEEENGAQNQANFMSPLTSSLRSSSSMTYLQGHERQGSQGIKKAMDVKGRHDRHQRSKFHDKFLKSSYDKIAPTDSGAFLLRSRTSASSKTSGKVGFKRNIKDLNNHKALGRLGEGMEPTEQGIMQELNKESIILISEESSNHRNHNRQRVLTTSGSARRHRPKQCKSFQTSEFSMGIRECKNLMNNVMSAHDKENSEEMTGRSMDGLNKRLSLTHQIQKPEIYSRATRSKHNLPSFRDETISKVMKLSGKVSSGNEHESEVKWVSFRKKKTEKGTNPTQEILSPKAKRIPLSRGLGPSVIPASPYPAPTRRNVNTPIQVPGSREVESEFTQTPLIDIVTTGASDLVLKDPQNNHGRGLFKDAGILILAQNSLNEPVVKNSEYDDGLLSLGHMERGPSGLDKALNITKIPDETSTKFPKLYENHEVTLMKKKKKDENTESVEKLLTMGDILNETSLKNVTLEHQHVPTQYKEEQFIEDLLEKLMMNMSNLRRLGDQGSSLPLLDTAGSVRIPCYVIIFLLGVVGNSLVIVTLLQNRKMRTITNVFLLNLAFSDLLLGVFCMPFTLVGSLLRDFIFGAIMCRLIPYFQAVSVSVSVWTLVAISLERYYAICQPLRSRGWQTLSHAYKIISLVWLLSLVFMAPIAALSQLLPIGDTSRHKCREMWPSLHLERGFSMFLGAVLLLVPLVIMTVAYSSITVSLWHGMRLERETGQGTRSLISLTDLHGLAMVQRSLQRKQQSKKHASKISIRFRKIPAQTRSCEHCEQPNRFSRNPEVPLDPPNGASSCPSAPSEDGNHVCLHGRNCENFKWHVEAVSANGDNASSPTRKSSTAAFKRLRSTHLEKSIEAKKHVIRMLFVVVLEFFLCWTPIFVVNIMCLYIPEPVYRTLGSFGISFLHLLSYASSCCNPITYCFMNKKFLQGFRHAFGCRKETDRIARQNGTAASFRSQSNNALRFAVEIKKDNRETTV